MTILVLGATGTVGSEVVRSLLAHGARVRALSRNPERARSILPSVVDVVVGDVAERESLARAFHGVSAAFYASPHEPDEEALARNVIEVAEASRVRLVFLGVHADGPNRVSRAFQRFFFGALLPHYRPKLRISEHVRMSRATTTLLLAPNFFQNDELFRESLLAGEFVTPLRGVNRVDVRDIGDGAARVLLDPSLSDEAYPVVGPCTLSGEESAKVWADALGRPVRYVGSSPAHFEREARRVLTGKKLEDVLASFRVLARMRFPTSAREVEATTKLLGRPSGSYDSYVREAIARWKASDHARPPREAVTGSPATAANTR